MPAERAGVSTSLSTIIFHIHRLSVHSYHVYSGHFFVYGEKKDSRPPAWSRWREMLNRDVQPRMGSPLCQD